MIPRVFGCVCFVHVQHPESKFSPRALKCVFVGYFRTHKGYKCFHSPHKFYVSVDVTFFKSTPYFSPHGSSHDESILKALTPIQVFFPPKSFSPPSTSTEIDVLQGLDTSLQRLPIYLCQCLIHLFRVKVLTPQCPLPSTL